MALVARDMDAIAPEIVRRARRGCACWQARHPLLMTSVVERVGIARRSTREPVPVTIEVTDGATVLVISGPNTGGKTVALKTVGLMALMAQSGLHIPAAPGSSLPVFRRVYADIGDEQSIAANLSTFSAHLANIVSMTRDLATPALVLLDEVGAGTDPTEGGALGVAIVDMFRARGAMAIATTHHGLMKAYAQSTEGVTPASFGYDPATYEPTYRLEIGTAGRSLALEMAERLGLPAETVRDARSRLDLQGSAGGGAPQEARRGPGHAAGGGRGPRRGAGSRSNPRKHASVSPSARSWRKKRTEVETFARELRRRGEEAVRKAARLHRRHHPQARGGAEVVGGGGGARQVRRWRGWCGRRRTKSSRRRMWMRSSGSRRVVDAPVAMGMRVKVRSLGVTGEVMGLHGDEAELAVSGKRMRVPTRRAGCGGWASGNVARHDPPLQCLGWPRRREQQPRRRQRSTWSGLTVDEALPKLDKALDNAMHRRDDADPRHPRLRHRDSPARRRGIPEGPSRTSPTSTSRREGRGGVTVVELKA